MTSNIAAIVHKNHSKGIQTFSDLLYRTDLSYGVIIHSAIHHYFHHSKDSILRKMYDRMITEEHREESFVRSRLEGIERANTSAFAFIADTALLEFVANSQCDLRVIYDTNEEFPDARRHYALALRKGSKYLNAFDFALNELNKTGELRELINRFWTDDCHPSHDSVDTDINSCLPLDSVLFRNYLILLTIFALISCFT